MDHSRIIAQIIRERVMESVILNFTQAGVVPEGRELIPGDEYFRNNVNVRARTGMKQHVDVLKTTSLTPRYHAHGTVSAEFYGGTSAYSFQLKYSFTISLEDVMRVIASQAEGELDLEGFQESEEK